MDLSNEINYSTITKDQIAAHDKGLLVTFLYHPKEYREDGEIKFRNIEYIKIRPPGKDGTLSEVMRPVTEDDKQRFKARYEQWKNGEETPLDGVPLKMWPEILPADLSACKAESLQTVEQLAEASDSTLQRAGLVNLKYRAIQWLKNREDNQHLNRLLDEIERLKKENENLKAILEEKASGNTDTADPPRRRRGRPRKTG